jgi:hypothetical protein
MHIPRLADSFQISISQYQLYKRNLHSQKKMEYIINIKHKNVQLVYFAWHSEVEIHILQFAAGQ